MTIVHIDDVRTFVAVVEAGSVSRAAHELHLTQPAVTRRVQRLEHAVGAPLMDRRTRPFSLTEVGQAAVERCRGMLATTRELKALARTGNAPSQEVRVGVAHALTEVALTEPVDELRQEFPTVVLRLHTGWSRELLMRVRSGALDAAVILLPEADAIPAGVEGHILATEHLTIVAPRRWRSKSLALGDLRGAGWILNPEGCGARGALQRALARVQIPLRVTVETYDYELQLALIARGRGLGLVPSRLLKRSASRGRLRALRVRGLAFPFTIWMATRELVPPLNLPVAALGRILSDRFRGRQSSQPRH